MRSSKQPFIFKRKVQNYKHKIKFLMSNINREELPDYPINVADAWKVKFAFGGYGEKRNFYSKKNNAEEFISYHTGIDLFVSIDTPIIAPFNAILLSVHWIRTEKFKMGCGSGTTVTLGIKKKDMDNFFSPEYLDYLFCGKDKMIMHFTHLDIEKTFNLFGFTIEDKKVGGLIYKLPKNFETQKIKTGQKIGFLGDYLENGGWAQHTHLETYLVDDFDNFKGLKSLSTTEKTQFQITGVLNGPHVNFNKFKEESFSVDPISIFNFEKNTKSIHELTVKPYENNADSILEAKEIFVELEKQKILNNINFKVKQGEFIAILGPSGSGKTTLLNTVAGLVKAKSGLISFNGIDNIGFVFQNYSLYETISVYENIAISIKSSIVWNIHWYFGKLDTINKDKKKYLTKQIEDLNTLWKSKIRDKKYILSQVKRLYKNTLKNFKDKKTFSKKKDINSDILKVCKILKIDSLLKKKPSTLSGGQKQRVAIAKALGKKPDLLLLDEPFSSLDYQVKISIRTWLKKIQKKLGITTMFVTHDQDDAMWLSSKIIFLSDGRVLQYDTPSNLFSKPLNLTVAEFIGTPKINYLKTVHNKMSYIRGNHINLKKSKQGKYEIYDVSSNGNYFVIKVKQNNSSLKIITTEKYNEGDRVKVIIEKDKVVRFDSETKNLVS